MVSLKSLLKWHHMDIYSDTQRRSLQFHIPTRAKCCPSPSGHLCSFVLECMESPNTAQTHHVSRFLCYHYLVDTLLSTWQEEECQKRRTVERWCRTNLHSSRTKSIHIEVICALLMWSNSDSFVCFLCIILSVPDLIKTAMPDSIAQHHKCVA